MGKGLLAKRLARLVFNITEFLLFLIKACLSGHPYLASSMASFFGFEKQEMCIFMIADNKKNSGSLITFGAYRKF